ncbi:hypothetical protein T01_2681 [Trichinella spiralis]|uniref:Apple domain-containing protein n=1 Tax=Trichinella spiralis TaxID=6334 RepID=A0A0V1BYB4_TRISP|nr:hypothetical protein T01_2681 [Trichinella spiralis]
MYHHLFMKTCLLKMQKCFFKTFYLCAVRFAISYSSEMQIYVPELDKICSMQQIGIRQEILDITDLFLFNASFKSCIAYSYSDLNPNDYSIFAYNEKASSCAMLHGMLEENIIVNCSEQLHDLKFYKVIHCLPAQGFMYSFEEEVEENVNRISAVKLKATAEICIVKRHPFSENFLLKRTGMLFLQNLELCLAHCRVLSVRGKCHAVLFSGEERVCLLLRQNQPLQSRDVMRKSTSQFFTLNYCDYNMTEGSERRYYNSSGKIIKLRVESMQIQCTVHEIPLHRKHMKHQSLLWKSMNFKNCIHFCARQFQANLCNAVYFEAEEKTCLHMLLNASQALYEYSESKKETVHFIEKCVKVAEQQEYQQESAINRIQSDETSISSPSRPRSSRTHNVREQELDFFHYVAAEDVHEQYAKLYEFFEICKIQVLNIRIIRNAFAIQIRRKIYSLNRCLHMCRKHISCMAVLFSQLHHQCKKIFKGRSSNSILVHAHELVVALKGCFKVLRNADTLFILYNRPAERKYNAEPLIYYFEETQEICAAEIYKQKNLTSWEVMAINKDIILNLIFPTILIAFHLANLVENFAEDGIIENVTRLNMVSLPALNEICIIERLPFINNFAANRLHKVLMLNILTCFAHCRVLNWTIPCNAVLFSREEGICLFLDYNDTDQESGTIRRNYAEFYSIKHCEFSRMPVVPNYDFPVAQSSFEFYIFNEQILMECKIEKKRLQQRYFSYITSLFSPVEFAHCLAICLNGYIKTASCDAIYYAENGYSCLFKSCKPATTLPIQHLTNIHDFSNLSENDDEEVYSYSNGNALAAEANDALVQDSSVETAKLHKFMEICHIQRRIITEIDYVSVFTFNDPVWTLNMCLHRCRDNMHGESRCSAVLFSRLNRRCKLLSHANDANKYLIEPCEEFVSILACAKVAILDILDREMERIDNPEPVNFYLEELRQICKVEFYVLKNLTQWKELRQLNNVTTFNECLLSCIMESMQIPCSAINYSTSGECILLMNGRNDEFFEVKDGTLFGEIIDCALGNNENELLPSLSSSDRHSSVRMLVADDADSDVADHDDCILRNQIADGNEERLNNPEVVLQGEEFIFNSF